MSQISQLPANTNPLSKHFRQPAIYVKLTSQGQYWAEGSLDLPVTGKIPVYPMTTRDEITLRTPDALIDGTSVVEVLQSCCPNIKDAWAMPSVDVDSTLIAIRIASFGQTMTVSSKCPKCGEEHDYDINLGQVLDQIEMPDYSEPLELDKGVYARLRPMNYRQVSHAGSISFEEEQLLRSLVDAEMPDEVKRAKYNEHLNRMITLNVENAAHCTQSITADGVEVTNPEHIKEYYTNSNATVLKRIQERTEKLSEQVSIKPVEVKCTACEKDFKINVSFDYSSFFGTGS